MKLDFKGLKFNIWLIVFLVALGVVFVMGILQFSLIRPYFRDNKVQAVKLISQDIQKYVINDSSKASIDEAFKIVVDNNVCAIITNENGKIIYSADSLGASCVFNQVLTINDVSFSCNKDAYYLNEFIKKDNGQLNLTITNTKTNQETILYGKMISANLSNYYLYINSPLEPLDSLVNFFLTQYLTYTLIIIIVSIIIAIYISNKLSNPIVEMKKSADVLATGNYNVRFNNSYFTETNELANTLNDATDKLSKVDELRKDLIANVSHDIKTPLTMIKAYAEMIMDISGDNPVKREEHLNVIISEVDYLTHLVNDMSELSKLQSGNYVLEQTNFDIVKSIREVVSLNEVLIDSQKISMEYEMDDSVIVYGDEFKIKQVIYNFVSNAIKHTKDHARIIIRVIKMDECVRVEVCDNGDGIKSEDLPYIWDRYYKIDKSFRRNQTSTGLGLAIVKALLDAHDANYGVTSELGKGSCFYFELKQENVF